MKRYAYADREFFVLTAAGRQGPFMARRTAERIASECDGEIEESTHTLTTKRHASKSVAPFSREYYVTRNGERVSIPFCSLATARRMRRAYGGDDVECA